MKGCKLHIAGDWGHFRRPETNNQPLTHDFITKTALLGMMGAVLGKSREEMKELFPLWSEAFLYGVCSGIVKKESWSFTMRVPKTDSNEINISPKQMEILKKPDYIVFLALNDEKHQKDLSEFIQFIKEQKAIYNPVLGIHNCPVNKLELLAEGDFQEKTGDFETKGFVPLDNKPELPKVESGKVYYRWGYEKLPTFQNNDWWNLPEKYIKVSYVANGLLKGTGKRYVFNNEAICLI